MAYKGNPKKATDLYVGTEYIQHNPLVGDGIQPLIDYFDRIVVFPTVFRNLLLGTAKP